MASGRQKRRIVAYGLCGVRCVICYESYHILSNISCAIFSVPSSLLHRRCHAPTPSLRSINFSPLSTLCLFVSTTHPQPSISSMML